MIPALNEATTIAAVVAGAARFGTPIVVDDGSTDNTGARAREAGAEVVRHAQNRGYDGALDSGVAHAAALGVDLVVTLDADGQHDPRTVESFIAALDDGAEVVLGVRDRRQRLAEHVFAWLTSRRWGIRDPLCGMKGYRMEVWRSLGHFDRYQSIGTELALHAARTGRRIVQLPVPTRDRQGQPRFGRRLSANMKIFRAAWIGMTA